MTDDQTKAQVIEPAKQIVAAADLQGVTGAFSFWLTVTIGMRSEGTP